MAGRIIVYPSAAARPATSTARLPPAPGRLSITTCCPHASASLTPTMRASTSFGPPAGYGTIRRTGRFGKTSAAAAAAGKDAIAAIASAASLLIEDPGEVGDAGREVYWK